MFSYRHFLGGFVLYFLYLLMEELPYQIGCRGLDRSAIDFVDVRGVYYFFKTRIVPGYAPGTYARHSHVRKATYFRYGVQRFFFVAHSFSSSSRGKRPLISFF